MSKLIFSNEIKTITKILNSPNLSNAELLSIKYSLLQLAELFPEKKDSLYQKSNQVQNRINKNLSPKLVDKILNLY